MMKEKGKAFFANRTAWQQPSWFKDAQFFLEAAAISIVLLWFVSAYTRVFH
jgi:hypothetical protein